MYNHFTVPPENVQILDEQDSHIAHYRLGPYNEGGSVNLTCISHGGKFIIIIHSCKYSIHFTFIKYFCRHLLHCTVMNFPFCFFFSN